MSGRPWMPLYIGDYLADTGHLSTVEHGAYMLLIMHYWQNDGIPDDDRRLASISRLDMEAWQCVRPTLADLFEPGWKHKRIDAELTHAKQVQSKRRASAQLRHSKCNANAEQTERYVRVAVSVEDSSNGSGKGVYTRERLDAIEAEAREAAGLENDPSPGLLVLAPLTGMLDAGYDWRADILPVMRSAKAKGIKPSTWAYYVPPVTSAKAKNAAIPPKPAEKPGKPIVWLSLDDPLWAAASSRYASETGKVAKPHGSKHEDGIGFHFPAEFIPDSHPRDSFSQLSGTEGAMR